MDDLQNGKTKIQYLLGNLTPEEQHQIDEQLFVNDDYLESVLVTEDELIEDYLQGRLSESERQQFERNLLNRVDLRLNVERMRFLLSYADRAAPKLGQVSSAKTKSWSTEANKSRQGLSVYQNCLWITALFRSAFLASICVLLYLLSATSNVASPVVLTLFIILSALYVPLELFSVSRSITVAKLTRAQTQVNQNASISILKSRSEKVAQG